MKPVWAILAATLFAGCLPSSCSREESRALFAADSVSRAFAESLPVDTLALVFETPTERPIFELPRTLAFDGGGLAVSDAKSNQLVRLSLDGQVLATYKLSPDVAPGGIPFIVGSSADTLFVFSAGDNTITGLVDGRRVSHFALAAIDASKQLRYVAADETGFWVKAIDPDDGATAAHYDRAGTRGSAMSLDGPYWAHAGILRTAGDSVLSIRGYMPVVDAISATGQVDSLRLHGFDSPMLARMRLHRVGDAKSPPLLIPSAAFVGGRIYAINARPGWLRVDVYDSTLTLETILVEPNPGFAKAFYPTDIAVREEADRILVAISQQEPEPVVRLFSAPTSGPTSGRSGPSG